ncbi:MAG: hypothetical protein KDA79_06710 [Planctomycetaceae bacterium]|nr:hypothetical protein [Planctomycetaceae bacterium]
MMIALSAAIFQICAAAVLAAVPGDAPPAAPSDVSASASAQPAARHDPFAGADEVIRHSFSPAEDRDFDQLPDRWTRRKGVQFPRYVRCTIDRNQGVRRESAPLLPQQSLHMELNGGQAAMYSPVVPLKGIHSYVFEGRILTSGLKHNAAMLSLSFLNSRRQRIQRYLTQPVTGTHSEWVTLRIGAVAPGPEARFVVIGCHLLQGKRKDIRGDVWFDELWVGRLPLLTLESNYQTHFRRQDSPIEVTSYVSGLSPGHNYHLEMQITDSSNYLVDSRRFDFREGPEQPAAADGQQPASSETQVSSEPADTAAPSGPADNPPDSEPAEPERHKLDWKLPPQENGFYRVISTLYREEEVIVQKVSSFIVIDLITHPGAGRFGWSMETGTAEAELRELADIAPQAGINWIKLPLWRSVSRDDLELPGRISEFLELLSRRRITPVGILDDPPDNLRQQFSRNWPGVSEIFMMPTSFWSGSLEPVIARYSSHVQYWQLGSERDTSFIGRKNIADLLGRVKDEFDHIGRDTRLGVHWDWDEPLPSGTSLPQSFLSVSSSKRLTEAQLQEKLQESKLSGVPRWVLIRPLPRSTVSTEMRGADLIQRMVAAHAGGAEAIFASDVFDPEHGLLRPNGAPQLLFLPWRITATALQGSTWLGSLTLPGGSVNHLFDRGDEAVLVMWNEEPVTEKLFLGNRVQMVDLWGRQRRPETDPETGQQIFLVGPVPTIVRGCSREVALMRLAVRYASGQAASASGSHLDAVTGRNAFPQGIDGTVKVHMPAGWDVQPGEWALRAAVGEEFRLPLALNLPGTASQGKELTEIEFNITADRPYRFRAWRTYEIGLGDLHLAVVERVHEDGRYEIEQIITNNTTPEERLDFRCSLFVPGHRRQKRNVTRLGNGQDRKLFLLPSFAALEGQELWLRAEEMSGRRVLNLRWIAGSEMEQEKKESTDELTNTLQSRTRALSRRVPEESLSPKQ